MLGRLVVFEVRDYDGGARLIACALGFREELIKVAALKEVVCN
jgi:hypothetical protein